MAEITFIQGASISFGLYSEILLLGDRSEKKLLLFDVVQNDWALDIDFLEESDILPVDPQCVKVGDENTRISIVPKDSTNIYAYDMGATVSLDGLPAAYQGFKDITDLDPRATFIRGLDYDQTGYRMYLACEDDSGVTYVSTYNLSSPFDPLSVTRHLRSTNVPAPYKAIGNIFITADDRSLLLAIEDYLNGDRLGIIQLDLGHPGNIQILQDAGFVITLDEMITNDAHGANTFNDFDLDDDEDQITISMQDSSNRLTLQKWSKYDIVEPTETKVETPPKTTNPPETTNPVTSHSPTHIIVDTIWVATVLQPTTAFSSYPGTHGGGSTNSTGGGGTPYTDETYPVTTSPQTHGGGGSTGQTGGGTEPTTTAPSTTSPMTHGGSTAPVNSTGNTAGPGTDPAATTAAPSTTMPAATTSPMTHGGSTAPMTHGGSTAPVNSTSNTAGPGTDPAATTAAPSTTMPVATTYPVTYPVTHPVTNPGSYPGGTY